MSDVNININLVTSAAQAQLDKFDTKMKKFDETLKGVNNRTKSFGDRLGSVGTIAKGVFLGNLIQNALYTVIGAVKEATTAFIDFEAELINIGKTTGIQGEELDLLGEQFQDLAKKIPVASSELTKIGVIAGQLGINGTKDIIKFTEVIARLGISVEGASTEEFAKQLSRIAGLTNVPIQEIDRLASAFVDLGNNVKANEAEISSIALRIASATKQFNLSAQDIAGLSATFAELGISAELGGSASLRIFRSITDAAATGGKALDTYTRLTGLTVDQFKDLARNAPIEILQKFAKGLNGLTSNAAEYNKTLKVLNLNELRAATAVSGLAGTYQQLEKNVTRGNRSFRENAAVYEESDRQAESTRSGLQLLSNSFNALAQDISEKFTPAIDDAARALAEDFNKASLEVQSSLGGTRGKIADLKLELLETERVIKNGGVELIGYGRNTVAVQRDITELTNKQIELNEQIGLLEGKLTNVDIQLNRARLSLGKLSAEEIELENKINDDKILEVFKQLDRERLAQVRKRIAEERSIIKNLSNDIVNDKKNQNAKLEQIDRDAAERQRIIEDELRINELQRGEEDLIQANINNEKRLEIFRKYYNDLARLRFDDKIDEAQAQNDNVKVAELQAKKRIFVNNKVADADKKTDDERVKNRDASLSQISSLMQSSNKELFQIGKAAAIAQATIDGELAVQKALAAAPPPFNYALAALVGAATAVQIKNIASQAPPKFQDGGIVAGNNFSGDRVAARVNSGEMILNRAQQSQLFQLANGQGGAGQSAPQEIVLNNVIEIDGEAVFKSVSRQVADGKILGENQ